MLVPALLLLSACGDDDPMTRPAPAPVPTAAPLFVGVSKRDISPSLMTAPPDGNVYLGGYGFGRERRSTGVLAPIYVRAFVISNGTQTVVFAQNETQGAFASYKRGAVGATDIAAAVESATGGAIAREHVIIGSDHSHAGPDTTGVWGGTPQAYLSFLKDQTVAAIVDAYDARRPARLAVGSTDATDLLRSQFSEPPNDRVDGELRVLIASDAANPQQRLGVLVNFAAHATVMGSNNLQVSSDWPGPTAALVEERLGVDTAVVMVADIGRTQPNRDGAPNASEAEKLAGYSEKVADRVLIAAAAAVPSSGSQIAASQLFLREAYTNTFLDPLLLIGIIGRNNQAPWHEVNDDNVHTVGTLVSAVRVGDLFFSAVPGEAYPAVQFELQQRVPARRHFIFGLANDQLGYLIAPQEGYAQVAAAAPGNDNALFNVSPTIGDHVMCTIFTAARDIGLALPADPDKCTVYGMEDHRLPWDAVAP